jgi:hypothetical protein
VKNKKTQKAKKQVKNKKTQKAKKQVMVVEDLALQEGAGVGWWRIWQPSKDPERGGGGIVGNEGRSGSRVVVEEKLAGGGRSGSGHFKQSEPSRR